MGACMCKNGGDADHPAGNHSSSSRRRRRRAAGHEPGDSAATTAAAAIFDDFYVPASTHTGTTSRSTAASSTVVPTSRRRGRRRSHNSQSESLQNGDGAGPHNMPTARFASLDADVADLIRQTLYVIRFLVNNEQEPPTSLLKLNMIADKEKGWLVVVTTMVEVVPEDDPLGPAVITLFLDESPLPTKEAVGRLLFALDLRQQHRPTSVRSTTWHRNASIVLGCLAEKLAGSASLSLCTPTTLSYLLNNLNPSQTPSVILYSLIALEKLAQTSENRAAIQRAFESASRHPLQVLESWLDSSPNSSAADYVAQQVAFCAQWSLDNIFVLDGRPYAYERADVSQINAMLNHEDVSEYLKIAPNGLEARCDVSSFESVRCTFEAGGSGSWFYEAELLTPGVMQIGWATKRSKFLNHEGYGIGDDDSSVAYDGCRQLLWHNALSEKHDHPPWQPGDILGCLLDLDALEVMFYLNGRALTRPHTAFLERRASLVAGTGDGIFAAASFMSFQQCRFNFGASPFRHPPQGHRYRTFNSSSARLSTVQKTILPRRLRLEMLQKQQIPDDYCTLCYSQPANTLLEPCGHDGMCFECAVQVELCPLCRTPINRRVQEGNEASPDSRQSDSRLAVHTEV